MSYDGPKMVPMHRTPDGDFKRNKIPTRLSMARLAGVDPTIIKSYETSGRTKVAAQMVVKGYTEFEGPTLDGLLAFDDDWRAAHGKKRPESLIEYLYWHRQFRRTQEIAKARNERAEIQQATQREQRRIRREERWRIKEAKRQAIAASVTEAVHTQECPQVTINVVGEKCRLTSDETLARRIATRRRAKAKEKALRHVAMDAALARELQVEQKAFELLGIVCKIVNVEEQRVTSKAICAYLSFVRQVFVCLARDTTYCGEQPSFPLIAAVIGRPRAHSCAFKAHAAGSVSREVCSVVDSIATKLGIDPPAYAKAKAETQAA